MPIFGIKCAFFDVLPCFLTNLLVHNFKNWIFSIDFLLCFLIFNVTTFPPEWNGATHFPTDRKDLFVIFSCIKIMTYLLFPLTMLSPNTEGDREALGYRAVSRHPGNRNRNIRKLKHKIFWVTQECDHVVPGREAEVRVLDPVHPHTHQVAPASALSTVIIRCGVLAIFSLYYGPNRVRVMRSRVDTQISTQTMANGWWLVASVHYF